MFVIGSNFVPHPALHLCCNCPTHTIPIMYPMPIDQQTTNRSYILIMIFISGFRSIWLISLPLGRHQKAWRICFCRGHFPKHDRHLHGRHGKSSLPANHLPKENITRDITLYSCYTTKKQNQLPSKIQFWT